MTRSEAIRAIEKIVLKGTFVERNCVGTAWTVSRDTAGGKCRVGLKEPLEGGRSSRIEFGEGHNYEAALEMAAAKVAGRKERPADVAKEEEGLTRRLAERIATATVGYDRYLNGPNDALYWSEFKDEDERDNGPQGARTYTNPAAALTAVVLNVGRLVVPDGIEGPQFEEASQ